MKTPAIIEVRGFKWPRRPTGVAVLTLLGEDTFGRWLGAARGEPWWNADGSRGGVFVQPLVKLVPDGTFWSACFHPVDPVVDVDIVLPVHWAGNVLEEVDLELDVLRTAGGSVSVRDRDVFDHVRATWAMPDDTANQALETCEQLRELVEQGAEPFGSIGRARLERFVAGASPAATLG